MKKKLLLLFFVAFNFSAVAKNDFSDSNLKMQEAENLVKQGKARVISKKELNNIKKNNIRVEIDNLLVKKKSVSSLKKQEVDSIEQTRKKELAKINSKFDEERREVETKRNGEIADILKMVNLKNNEIKMIDKMEMIALKAKQIKKEQMKRITIYTEKGMKEHIHQYKHINNVLIKLPLIDSLSLYIYGKEKVFNYGVQKRLKDYVLAVAYKNNDIDFYTFETMLNNGSIYELKNLLKILKSEYKD